MPALPHDTSRETQHKLIELYRQKTPSERMALADDMTQFVHDLVRQSIEHDYPNASEEERRCRFAARWLGREWAIRVFNWDPEVHGW